ncbi:MAG: hypothetical protein NSGCLCUN01_02849 [uncultured Clostridium sp.]
MENKMIKWINNYIDELKKDGKKETIKKLELKYKNEKNSRV